MSRVSGPWCPSDRNGRKRTMSSMFAALTYKHLNKRCLLYKAKRQIAKVHLGQETLMVGCLRLAAYSKSESSSDSWARLVRGWLNGGYFSTGRATCAHLVGESLTVYSTTEPYIRSVERRSNACLESWLIVAPSDNFKATVKLATGSVEINSRQEFSRISPNLMECQPRMSGSVWPKINRPPTELSENKLPLMPPPWRVKTPGSHWLIMILGPKRNLWTLASENFQEEDVLSILIMSFIQISSGQQTIMVLVAETVPSSVV